MNNLPAGWIRTKLGEITRVVGGGTPRREITEYFKKGTILWAVPTDLHSEQIDVIDDTPTKITRKGLQKSSAALFPAGSVLFSSRASIGKIAIAGKDMSTNQGFANFICSDGVYNYYLAYSLRNFTEDVKRLASGTTYLEVSKGRLREYRIPLPPLPEQHRIVKKVDSLFERLNKSKEELAKIPPLIRKFRQSVLVRAFNGELTKEWREQQKDLESASALLEHIRTERKKQFGKKYKEPQPIDISNLAELPEGWEWAALGSIMVDGRPGFASGKKDVKDGLAHLRMNNINSECKLNLDLVRTVHRKLGEEKYILQKGDVLICHTNSQKLIGKTAMFNLDGKFAFSNHLTRIRFFGDTIKSEWIWHYIGTLWRQGYFETRCKQWVNQATIERDTLLNIPIPIPPFLEQDYAIKKIRELFARADAIEEAVKIAQARCEKLTQSILAKASRGELVAQDPNDEPASELIKRIEKDGRKHRYIK